MIISATLQLREIYADDNNITIASNDKGKLVADAQAKLHNISEWMRVNKLSLNPLKSEYMTKFQGLMVDEYLKSVKSKICGGLASLKELKNILLQPSYVVFIMLLCKVIFATQM